MKKIGFVLLIILFSKNLLAGSCDWLYYKNTPPKTTIENTHELCLEKTAIMFNRSTKIAIWSAEKLTKSDIEESNGVKRSDDFHEEELLSTSERATLKDYIKSGFDRGHLTPDRDFPKVKSIDSLANIVPQAPKLNRGEWKNLESKVRNIAEQYGEIFVVTGTITGTSFIGNNINIPSKMFKVVITPSENKTEAYIADNINEAKLMPIGIKELQELSSIELLTTETQ